jgi:hypothetical protein
MQSDAVAQPVVADVAHLPLALHVVAVSVPARLFVGQPPHVSAVVPGVHDPEYMHRLAVQVHVPAAHCLPSAEPQ